MKKIVCNSRGDICDTEYRGNLRIQTYQWNSETIATQPLFVRCAMIAERHGECYFQHRRCPELILSLVTDGAVSYEEGGETVTLEAGSLYCAQYDSTTAFFTRPGGYYKKEVLCVNGIIRDRLVESLRFNACRELKLRDPDSIRGVFRQLFDLLERKQAGTEKVISGILYNLLVSLAEEYHATRNPRPDALCKAIHYMERHFTENIHLADIRAAAGTSQSTLIRLFQKYLSIHPKAYLMDIRLEFARSLLLTSDMPLKEIAWRAGYNSPFYFSTAFRRKWGISPKAYRRNRPDIHPYAT